MEINLFTFLIQIVNFLVLLFILNRILIKPLLKSVEERRKNILKQNEELALKKEELDNGVHLYDSKIADFEKFKIEEKRKLELEIQEEKNLKSIEIQQEFEKEREKFLDKFMLEKDSLVNNITESICLKMSDLFEKIFLDLADEELEDRVIKKFIFQLKNLNSDEINKIKNLDNSIKINIYSSYNLSINNKDLITNFFVNSGISNELVFIENKDIIFGIKMEIGNIVLNSNLQNIIEQFSSVLKKTL